jgi:hypothetical protein
MQTYSSILATYKAVEQGDFFRQYKIDGNTYILFSPVKGKVSCIETFNFTEITPGELALYMDIMDDGGEVPEFIFEVSCTKDIVLSYIFDIKSIESFTGEYSHYVGKNSGIMLLDAKMKTRNIFDIDADKNESRLVFDNTTCFRSNNLLTADKVFICFDPLNYKKLVHTLEIGQSHLIYLLASTNPMLLELVFEKERDTSVLMGERDSLKTLALILFYLRKKGYTFELYHDEKQVTVAFPVDMETEDIINLSSHAEKNLRGYYGITGKVCYELRKMGEKCFLNFRNFSGIIRSFNIALMNHFSNPLRLVI